MDGEVCGDARLRRLAVELGRELAPLNLGEDRGRGHRLAFAVEHLDDGEHHRALARAAPRAVRRLGLLGCFVLLALMASSLRLGDGEDSILRRGPQGPPGDEERRLTGGLPSSPRRGRRRVGKRK